MPYITEQNLLYMAMNAPSIVRHKNGRYIEDKYSHDNFNIIYAGQRVKSCLDKYIKNNAIFCVNNGKYWCIVGIITNVQKLTERSITTKTPPTYKLTINRLVKPIVCSYTDHYKNTMIMQGIQHYAISSIFDYLKLPFPANKSNDGIIPLCDL